MSSSIAALVLALFLPPANPTTHPVDGIFPDKRLEEAVRPYVFEKRYNEEPITAEDVAKISSIVARGKKIENLEGIQHCRALMLLDVGENAVADLAPVRELRLLQSLDVSKNRVTSLAPVEELANLQYLNAEENQIEDVKPVAGLVKLNSLYLTANRVADVSSLGKLEKLWSLYLGKNQITDVSVVASMKRLSTLDIAGNRVVSIEAVRELRQVRLLFLEDNQIASLAPLVASVEEDAAQERRFAPFLRLYLKGNPLADATEVERLTKAGCRVLSR